MVYSTAEILPFYGHNTKQQYCEFSNFYWHDTAFRFVMPDFAKQSWTPPEIDCHFSEKAIMAIKASLFDDAETFKLIDAAVTPSETKALGRMVKNFNEELWSKHLDQTAFEVVFQKFNSSKRLRELLLKTGKTLIVEAAPNDRIWGVGIAKSDRRIWDPKQWEGKNVLGKALMQARDRLMGGPAEAAPEPQRIDSAGASEATTAAPDPKRGRWQKSEAAKAKAKAKVACDKQRDIKTLLTQSQESPECASDYDCYVVLDFEATCWEGRHADQEIIEFPLVLVDAKTLTQVDEFRTYVRPEQNPTLSQFCTKLTGITQEQVILRMICGNKHEGLLQRRFDDLEPCPLLSGGSREFQKPLDWISLVGVCRVCRLELSTLFQKKAICQGHLLLRCVCVAFITWRFLFSQHLILLEPYPLCG
ncbi:unnamed protein product [Durusdinium trenchii]|uniref:NADAR domain-containing protein n=1 Tax=Durusdinium trenchii TaxID=1381693 RepID=A0ABP0RI78_9DINO